MNLYIFDLHKKKSYPLYAQVFKGAHLCAEDILNSTQMHTSIGCFCSIQDKNKTQRRKTSKKFHNLHHVHI